MWSAPDYECAVKPSLIEPRSFDRRGVARSYPLCELGSVMVCPSLPRVFCGVRVGEKGEETLKTRPCGEPSVMLIASHPAYSIPRCARSARNR